MSEDGKTEPNTTPKTIADDADGTCKHDGAKVHFDVDRARTMNTGEIRKAFPRFFGNCPDCGCSLIKYASFEHYLYGDW